VPDLAHHAAVSEPARGTLLRCPAPSGPCTGAQRPLSVPIESGSDFWTTLSEVAARAALREAGGSQKPAAALA
jgi:hypothetical protein